MVIRPGAREVIPQVQLVLLNTQAVPAGVITVLLMAEPVAVVPAAP